METLTEKNLTLVEGGISKTIWLGIGLGVIFLASVVYGIIYPNKC